MDACVRNGYYHDAIELYTHARRFEDQYPASRLVHDVIAEVEAVRCLMITQLVTLLGEAVKLPTLIKTVSLMRRLHTMDEHELAVVYLSSRLHNFRAHIETLTMEKAEPARVLRRYIDHFREHIYDILAQFTTIFHEAELITAFAAECVVEFTRTVADYLPRIQDDAASMSSLLVQLGYCAMSFSRLGLDFSPIFHRSFSDCILATYKRTLEKSTGDFTQGLQSQLSLNSSLEGYLSTSSDHAPWILSETENDDTQSLFSAVSSLPPLAKLVNAHLGALNTLRLLAPQHQAQQMDAIQASALSVAMDAILEYLKHTMSTKDSSGGVSHRRSGSSPRAQLLRRNTETQMSPETLATRRRHTQNICISFAWATLSSVRHLRRALTVNTYGHAAVMGSADLERSTSDMRSWLEEVSGISQTVTANGYHVSADPPIDQEPAPAATDGDQYENVHLAQAENQDDSAPGKDSLSRDVLHSEAPIFATNEVALPPIPPESNKLGSHPKPMTTPILPISDDEPADQEAVEIPPTDEQDGIEPSTTLDDDDDNENETDRGTVILAPGLDATLELLEGGETPAKFAQGQKKRKKKNKSKK